MNVLMYGWEFPPYISGGLGIACYAIVKELAKKNINLTLVLPHTTTDSVIDHVSFVNCDSSKPTMNSEAIGTIDIKYSKIAPYLSPYITVKNFNQFLVNETPKNFLELLARIHLSSELKSVIMLEAESEYSRAQITGMYSSSLLAEVFRYALVAGALAKNTAHDVIHAHDWLTMLAALEAKHCSNKPVVIHIHALETDRSGLWVDKRIFAIEKFGMEQADQILAVSQYTKNNIVKHYAINPEKITVVHNGVYCDEYPTMGLVDGDRPKMVLFLGRITQQKGPSFFIDVARRVLEKRSDIQFVLVGTGDLFNGMIERVAKLHIGKNVHFTGFLDREKVTRIYQLADVYVMPSVSEPFGLSALEAISYNVPLIISKQSGVSEVLHHTLMSDFWDIDDMAAKILALFEYSALRQTSVDNEKKELREITWAKAAEKIIIVYKKMLSR